MQIKLVHLYSILLIQVVLAIVSLPLGFDQHHSGLILSSLREFDNANKFSKEYPFNQYGPAWILIFHYILLLAPLTYYFLFVKILGFIFIFFTLFITYKLSRLFVGKIWALICTSFILVTYPFFSGFLPWPSLVVMPIVPFVSFTLIKWIRSEFQSKSLLWEFIFVGFTISVAILTRAQIGSLLLLATIFVLLVHGIRIALVPLMAIFLGLSIGMLIIFTHLDSKGWLISALYDEFVMGFMYVLGDKSTFPFPLGTIVMTSTFLLVASSLLYYSQENDLRNYASKIRFPFVVIPIALFLAFILSVNSRLFNRLWISFLIASFFLSFYYLLKNVLSKRSLIPTDFHVLIIFSGIALTQIWPLFDQMHAWWAITPISVVAILLIRKYSLLIGNKEILVLVFSLFISVLILTQAPCSRQLERIRITLGFAPP